MHRKPQNVESLKETLTVNSINVPRPRCRSHTHTITIKKYQTPPRGIKYDVPKIPVEFEEKKPNEVKKEISAIDFVEKLKKIEGCNDNTSFLEQANDEINTAYLQLLEIQKMIKKKVWEGTSQEVIEEAKRRKESVINNCNKQLERMQKKYLNKTKIHYKSVQDFENVTLKDERVQERKEKQEVEVLLSPKKTFPVASSEDLSKPKTLTKMSIVTPTTDKKMYSSLSFLENKPEKKRVRSNVSRIRYLLKPEHHGGTKTEETQVETKRITEATQVRTKKIKSILKVPQVPKVDLKTSEVRFVEEPYNQSILQPNFLSFANVDTSNDLDLDDFNEDLTGRFEEPQQKQESTNQKFEPQRLALLLKSVNKPPRFQIRSKIQDPNQKSTTTEEYTEGRKKLNLLLYGRDKLFDQVGDSEIVDSVLRSAYLSKEFVGPKSRFSNKTKQDSKVDLFESVIHKFRKLESSQLANLRDEKPLLLGSRLNGTLYTESRK